MTNQKDDKTQFEADLQAFEQSISAEFSKEDKLEEYVNTAKIYLEAMNEINRNYVEALDDIIDSVKDLKKTERDLLEKSKMAKAKVQLYK